MENANAGVVVQSRARYEAWVTVAKQLKEAPRTDGLRDTQGAAQRRYAQSGQRCVRRVSKYEAYSAERGRIMLDFEADPQ